MRYVDTLNGETDVSVPLFLRDFTLGTDVSGIGIRSIFSKEFNAELSADSICAFRKFTGQDAVIGCTHSPAFLIEQFGGKMRYPENGIPVPMERPFSGKHDFSDADMSFKGKIPNVFRSYKIVKERMSGTADVVANITGPLTKASVLSGADEISLMMISDPDVLHGMLSVCTEFTEALIEKFDSDGSADSFLIAAATDNPDLFGFDGYEAFSVPYLRRICRKIKDLGYTAAYHPHGTFVSRDSDRSDLIAEMDIDCYHFAEGADVALTAAALGDRMCLMGGTDIVPTLLSADTDSVRNETDRFLEALRDRRYIFAPSCSLNTGLPLNGIAAMCDTVRKFVR